MPESAAVLTPQRGRVVGQRSIVLASNRPNGCSSRRGRLFPAVGGGCGVFGSGAFHGSCTALGMCAPLCRSCCPVRKRCCSRVSHGRAVAMQLLDVARTRCHCLGTLGYLSSKSCSSTLVRPVDLPYGIVNKLNFIKIYSRDEMVVRLPRAV